MLYIVKPFAKISIRYPFISMRSILILGLIIDLDQWYLVPMGLIRDVIRGPLLSAKFGLQCYLPTPLIHGRPCPTYNSYFH